MTRASALQGARFPHNKRNRFPIRALALSDNSRENRETAHTEHSTGKIKWPSRVKTGLRLTLQILSERDQAMRNIVISASSMMVVCTGYVVGSAAIGLIAYRLGWWSAVRATIVGLFILALLLALAILSAPWPPELREIVSPARAIGGSFLVLGPAWIVVAVIGLLVGWGIRRGSNPGASPEGR
jgi:hypothetical protein